MADLRFPVYINSRGRAGRQLTANALLKIGIAPTLVVEEAEHAAYRAANPDCEVVAWPPTYWDDYERTPELDPHPTTGIGRNFAWDHSRERGFTHHWIMDDNIRQFYVVERKRLKTATTPTSLGWVEEFALRWENLGGVCLAMSAFVKESVRTPLVLNTRLYCATLMNNALAESGIRWRRGYNEDTITSIDILKTGYWCTAQTYIVAINKVGTGRRGRLEGGMSEFYADGGFIRKSAELVRVHPDCCRTSRRFQRVHHHCNYKMFQQQLIPARVDA